MLLLPAFGFFSLSGWELRSVSSKRRFHSLAAYAKVSMSHSIKAHAVAELARTEAGVEAAQWSEAKTAGQAAQGGDGTRQRGSMRCRQPGTAQCADYNSACLLARVRQTVAAAVPSAPRSAPSLRSAFGEMHWR